MNMWQVEKRAARLRQLLLYSIAQQQQQLQTEVIRFCWHVDDERHDIHAPSTDGQSNKQSNQPTLCHTVTIVTARE